MGVEQKVTYCRICEPLCGLVATVEDGRLTSLRPDPDHPLSRGQACPKGIAFTEVQNDPERVLHPLRRTASGEFEQVTWEQALDDISRRLRRVIAEHGGSSVGVYFGNPSAFSYSHAVWVNGFAQGLGTKHVYSAGSQDINSRFAASALLYGAVTQLPFPDLGRTDFLLMLGANPLVSHGSALNAPRIKDQLRDITRRGGRVVVVDPRRSETAKAFEHVAVRPDSDAWLLLSLLQVVFAEGLADEAALATQTTGVDWLRSAVAPYTPESTAARTGVDPETVRTLARDFAAAPSAATYARTGACLGRHATLVSYLVDVLAVVTGNLDRPGGTVFSRAVLPIEELAEKVGLVGYGRKRTRIGDFGEVLGQFPAAVMAQEMLEPGEGQLRALFVTAGNPVLSIPDGDGLAKALDGLDLMVSMDLYLNDTNQHADYVLPATTFLEREDVPVGVSSAAATPFLQATEAVLEPYGEARPEWEVFDEIARRAGVGMFLLGPLRRLTRPVNLVHRAAGRLITPRLLMDAALRSRRYPTLRRLTREHPHGIVLAEHPATGRLGKVVRHKDKKVHLAPAEIVADLARLGERHEDDPAYPLRLIGLREIRSHNSWMHNSATLMKGDRRHLARVNPADAAAHGVVDGGLVRISSRHGVIELPAKVTDEIGPGTVAVPHGWGHRGGGWTRALAAGGVNVNQLASADAAEIEPVAGMAHLNGIPVALANVER